MPICGISCQAMLRSLRRITVTSTPLTLALMRSRSRVWFTWVANSRPSRRTMRVAA